MTNAVDPKTARKTTLVVAIVCLLVGAWQVYRGRPTASEVLLGAGGLLTVVAFVPVAAVLFHRGWMRLAEALGYVNTRILLSAAFYIVVTPMRVILRATGHDPLGRRAPRQPSYWIPKAKPQQSREGFERAF